MDNWTVSWALFDLNGTLLDPSVIADPLGGTEEDRRLVAEAFHAALLLMMADTISGGPYRPLPSTWAPRWSARFVPPAGTRARWTRRCSVPR